MTAYLLSEAALCALVAAAFVGLTGGGVLAWKAAGRLVGGIRQARTRRQSRLSEVVSS